MADSRLDQIETLVTDIDQEAANIADAIEGETNAAGNIITSLQGVSASVSDPTASTKIDEIITALQQTKKNLGGLRDRVKAIIPDPSAVAPASGSSPSQQSSGGQSTTGTQNATTGQPAVGNQPSATVGQSTTGNTQNATTGQPVTTEEESVAPQNSAPTGS